MKLVLRENEVNNKADGTYYIDCITTSYFNLVNLLGEPTSKRGDKVLCEWVIESNEGNIATIYDYKSDTNDVALVTEWHLGGNKDSLPLIEEIKNKIEAGLKKENENEKKKFNSTKENEQFIFKSDNLEVIFLMWISFPEEPPDSTIIVSIFLATFANCLWVCGFLKVSAFTLIWSVIVSIVLI